MSHRDLYNRAEEVARETYRKDPEKWEPYTEEEFVSHFAERLRDKIVDREADLLLISQGVLPPERRLSTAVPVQKRVKK